jgi:hypothetical protein
VLDAVEHGVALPAFWAPFRDAPTHAAHAVEVAFVALLVARAAGFSAAFQHDLGIAALLHDAGYLSGEDAAGDDAGALERHAVAGARVLLRQRGFHAAKIRRVRAVLEHHRDFAGPSGPPSAAGAVLRLAEDYANVVRLYGARVTRGAALAAMLRGGGTLYHPALAQVLVNALGRYPPGEHVEVADGSRAIVAAPPATPEAFESPVVSLVGRAGGRADGALVDTARGPAVRRALLPAPAP